MTISRSILLKMRNVSNKSCRQNHNTHFTFRNFLPTIVPFIMPKKYGAARQAVDDNMAPASCSLICKATRARALARAPTHHANTNIHTKLHVCTHTRMQQHKHISCVRCYSKTFISILLAVRMTTITKQKQVLYES